MLRVQQLARVSSETGSDVPFREQALLHPQRPGASEGAQPAGRDVEIRLQQPLEFEQRFLIKNHRVQVGRGDSSFRQAVLRGMSRKALIPLDSGEALLLCCRYDAGVIEEACGAVVIESGYPEDVSATHWQNLLHAPARS